MSCGAAIVQDGAIVAAVTEERLTRIKMAFGFPRMAIAEVLRLAGARPEDVDLVTAATVNGYLFNGVREFDGWLEDDKGTTRNTVFQVAGQLAFLAHSVPGTEALYYKLRSPIFRRRRQTIRSIVQHEFQISAPLEFVDHHLAHATSAYFTSGLTDATVITMDGGGDGWSSHIYNVKDGAFERVGHTSSFNSVGNYYAYATQLCGFKAQKHEGKVTGLAAHGRPIHVDLLDEFITFSEGRLRNRGRVLFRPAVRAIHRRLPNGWRREDLASSIQTHAERLTTAYVGQHLSTGGSPHLAIAGGLFANVRINQELAEMPGVESVFIHPGMTDVGLAVGAALAPCMRLGKNRRMDPVTRVLSTVYVGPSYTPKEIASALDARNMAYTQPVDIEAEIAQLLADGYVVARFDGRMEYGPRALGNRSILYQPSDTSVNNWLNESLQRTEFMPFAPSTLMDQADKSYKGVSSAREAARFMTITFNCTEWMKQTCPGVVHLDGTARPQLVRQADNPSYYRILDEFRRRTGVGTVVNTSFNMHEEPIVCTPDDAIRAFQLGHLDAMAIGGFLVHSPRDPDRQLRAMAPGR